MKVFIYVFLQFKSEFKENYLALTSLKIPLPKCTYYSMVGNDFKKCKKLRIYSTRQPKCRGEEEEKNFSMMQHIYLFLVFNYLYSFCWYKYCYTECNSYAMHSLVLVLAKEQIKGSSNIKYFVLLIMSYCFKKKHAFGHDGIWFGLWGCYFWMPYQIFML